MRYSYFCNSCGELEVEQSMKDDKLTSCPNDCCGTSFERLISGGNGFQLKGGGWYADGYASNNSRDRKRFDEQTK